MFPVRSVARDIQPMREWVVIVSMGVLALVTSIVWNIFFFLETVSDKEGVTDIGSSETVDTSVVEQVRETFDKREVEEGRYRNEYQFIDPSR